MPYQYSKEEKLNAFRLLIETMGDVNHVSNETGIAKRTIQYWKNRYRIKVTTKPVAPPDESDRVFKEQYRFIRQKLFGQVMEMMKHMERSRTPEEMADLTPSLARLLDRVTKVENLIQDKHFAFFVQWLNPEELETNDFKIETELLKQGKLHLLDQ